MNTTKCLTMLAGLSLALLGACSSSSGDPADAPVITNFTLASPLAAGSSSVTGSLDITDSAGLAGLVLDLVVTGNGVDLPITSPTVAGASSSVRAGTIPVSITLSQAIPAGTYDVSITATAGGATSNSLSTTVVVQ
jgi:hypothetical protein